MPFRIGRTYVRGGAPIPSEPMIPIGCSIRGPRRFRKALANARRGRDDGDVTCPTANVAAFNAGPLDGGTARSSSGHRSRVNDADSAALIARKNDIANFFNQGGGIFALAGDSGNDAFAGPAACYQFVPIGDRHTSSIPPVRS